MSVDLILFFLKRCLVNYKMDSWGGVCSVLLLCLEICLRKTVPSVDGQGLALHADRRMDYLGDTIEHQGTLTACNVLSPDNCHLWQLEIL